MIGLLLLASKIALVVLVFDPLAQDSFALPKSVAAIASGSLVVALLFAVLRRHPDMLLPFSPLHQAIAVYALVNIGAFILAQDRFVALFGAPDHYLGLAALLDGLVVFLATALLVRSGADTRRLCLLVLLTTVPVLSYTVIQLAEADPIRWSGGGTVFSTFGNSGALGGYLAAMSMLAAALLVYLWSDLRPTLRISLVLLSLACAGAIFAVGTRAALLAIALGTFSMLLIGLRVLSGVPRRAFLAVAGAMPLVSAAALAFASSSPLVTRWQLLLSGADAQEGRVVIWRGAFDLVRERPLLGLGPDNFLTGYPRIRDAQRLAAVGLDDELSRSTHSWLARAAVDAGVLGLAAYLAIIGAAVYMTWRTRSPTAAIGLTVLATYLGQGLVAIEHVGVEWIPWFTLGLIASAAARDSQAPVSRPPRSLRRARPHPRSLAPDAAVLAAAVVVSALAWQQVGASEWAARSGAALAQGDLQAAIVAAQEATRLDPNRSAYWHTLGLAYSSAARWSEAAGALRRAAEIQPYQSDGWRNLAIAHLNRFSRGERGADREALLAAERGVAAEPNSAMAHFIMGRVALALGDHERAAAEGERAVALAPYRAQLYEVPAIAYVNLRRWEDAERIVMPRLNVPLYRLLAAQIYVETGRTEPAKQLLEAYLREDPGNAHALSLLKRAQEVR